MTRLVLVIDVGDIDPATQRAVGPVTVANDLLGPDVRRLPYDAGPLDPYLVSATFEDAAAVCGATADGFVCVAPASHPGAHTTRGGGRFMGDTLGAPQRHRAVGIVAAEGLMECEGCGAVIAVDPRFPPKRVELHLSGMRLHDDWHRRVEGR